MREAARFLPSGVGAALRLLDEFAERGPEEAERPVPADRVAQIADDGNTIIAAMRAAPPLDAYVGVVDPNGKQAAVGKVRRVGREVSRRPAPVGATWVEVQRFSGAAQVDWGVEEFGILGFEFRAGVGVDFTLGHDRSVVFPTIPDPLHKQITDATGSGLIELYLGYNFGRLFGEPVLSEFYVGADVKFGFGGFYRYSSVGGRINMKLYFPIGEFTLGIDLGVSLGALQHTAGGQDITDVLFFVLTDRKGVPAAQAAAELDRKRIDSDWLFYGALAPRVTLWLMPEFEIYVGLGLLFTPSSREFQVGDRRFNANDPDLQVPGFEWNNIGFQMSLGAVLHF